MQNREKYEEFLNNVQILKNLDPYEKNKLCDCLEVKNFAKGEYVIREGEQGDTFYMVMKGTAQASKAESGSNQEMVVYEYKENMYFGELALLRNTPRAASIQATVNFLTN
jgi:cAMP-dependent protein kinase regulator